MNTLIVMKGIVCAFEARKTQPLASCLKPFVVSGSLSPESVQAVPCSHQSYTVTFSVTAAEVLNYM